MDSGTNHGKESIGSGRCLIALNRQEVRTESQEKRGIKARAEIESPSSHDLDKGNSY